VFSYSLYLCERFYLCFPKLSKVLRAVVSEGLQEVIDAVLMIRNCSKCSFWGSIGINIATFRVPRGLWYKKGPQKWAFQQILSRFMSCQLFFQLHWHRAQVLFTNRHTIRLNRDRSPRNAPLRVRSSKNVDWLVDELPDLGIFAHGEISSVWARCGLL